MEVGNSSPKQSTLVVDGLLSLGVGFVLGWGLGFPQHDASFGLKSGSVVAMLFFLLLRWRRNWGVYFFLFFAMGTILLNSYFAPDPIANPSDAIREVPAEILKSRASWKFNATFYALSYFFLASASTILSLVIAVDFKKWHKYFRFFAFGAAIGYGIIATFDLGNKANRTREAWRLLNVAVLRYQREPDFTMRELLDAYYDGEETIGGVNPHPR